MDFSKALEAMKEGKKVRRSNWENGAYLSIGLKEQYGTETIILTSYIDGVRLDSHYCPISRDLLVGNWELVEDIPNDNPLYPELSPRLFSNTSILKDDFHISLPSMNVDKTLKEGSWTLQQEVFPTKTVLEFRELKNTYPQSALTIYRTWLETVISDWKAQIEICVTEKQYTSAGEFEKNVRLLERCLEKLDMIVNEQNK